MSFAYGRSQLDCICRYGFFQLHWSVLKLRIAWRNWTWFLFSWLVTYDSEFCSASKYCLISWISHSWLSLDETGSKLLVMAWTNQWPTLTTYRFLMANQFLSAQSWVAVASQSSTFFAKFHTSLEGVSYLEHSLHELKTDNHLGNPLISL